MNTDRKLWAVVGAVVIALVAGSVAQAGSGLAGSYTSTITSPAWVKGKWVLTLAGDGSYIVKWNGRTAARGTYSATRTTITFGRERLSGCNGSGTYRWERSGRTMTFVRKRESGSCDGRSAVLAHRFTVLG